LEGTGGLQPGQSVVVRGVIEGERFDINLSSDNSGDKEVPFHISTRLDEKKFVLNTLHGGQWGKEERHSSPYKKGDEFDIRIRAHQDKFEVFVNQKELCTFEYRQPLSSVLYLVIKGEIKLHGVNWGGKYYPVPYESKMDGGFKPGRKLYVSGMMEEKGGKRFCINLVNSKGEIVFHFNPRFDEKVIVRNAQLGGAWGTEEREGKFNLDKHKTFDIIIANETYAYQVFLNGQHFCAFAHRTDPNSVVGLQIQGDVELQGVHVK